MKILLIGESITWDTLAAALGYLGEPLQGNNWYGNTAVEQRGSVLEVGQDKKGNQVYVLGSSRPQIIAKVIDEISRLGYPRVAPVKVIIIKVPGQYWVRMLVRMARWRMLGYLALKAASIIARKYEHIWWQEGRNLAGTKLLVVD